MKIEDLSLESVSRCANSADLDTSEFGDRAIRLLCLSQHDGVIHAQEAIEIVTLRELLTKNLNNPAFRAHLEANI